MTRIVPHRLLPLFFALLISACGIVPEVQDETLSWPPEKLFEEAKGELDSKNFIRAIKLFETLEARYPYGRYAQQAQLEVAYAHYKDFDPILAIAACDRFIKQHPTHANVDYAYYLKGLINYNEDQGLLTRIVKQDMSERDPKAAKEAFFTFQELAKRFPNSRYADDARSKMVMLRAALAQAELHVARYYYERGAYLAAVNRAQYLVQNYPESTQREPALAVLVLAYGKLGLDDLAADGKRVLALNYPQSKQLDESVLFPERPWWRFW